MKSRRARAGRALALLLLVGCDPASFSAPAPGACTEAGVQCRLPDGPLGVCERARCAAGQTSPCFECTPQH